MSEANGVLEDVTIPEVPAIEEASPEKPKRSKAAIIAIGSILGVVLLVYLAGCLFFATHFYPNASMGLIDTSWMSQKRAAAALASEESSYRIDVAGHGLSFALSGQDIGLNLDESRILSSALKGNDALQWPIKIFGAHDSTSYLVATYDKAALTKLIDEQVKAINAKAVQPKNATVAFDANSGVFKVIPEEAGTALDQAKVAEVVDAAITSLDPTVQISDEALVQPQITTADKRLDEACASANTMIKTNLTLSMGSAQVAKLGPHEISEWVKLGDDLSVKFDDAAFDTWTERIVDGCNTVGTKRTYTRPDGKVVTVSGGSYGWKIDSDGFRTAIRKSVTEGQTGAFSIPVTQKGTGFDGIGGRDWGKKYCDIDLTEQYARFYNDAGALVWESPIVSGRPTGGHSTPTGVYKLNSGKASPGTLVGQPLPGETKPEYITKVAYWMPFVRNSIGLHDATWQSSFGGTRYKTGFGSHGCINLPLGKAKELYSLISVGDPVITHY